ncbi:MAG: KH domain-containing protein [Deltaproteobacteria bacterium]|jgi:predicted RNA-binding protein YlqC (UPF0109 family)|nr:KH domain-containing protein [Deltaproteobacteria bacterium]MCB9786765.1 KH domain-containing protein [Deltaproteobacteria bacterium]
METLIEYIAKGLVDDPDKVEVQAGQSSDPGLDVYELSVGEGDVGKVIGRQGRTARALRAVVRAAGARAGRRATVEILD